VCSKRIKGTRLSNLCLLFHLYDQHSQQFFINHLLKINEKLKIHLQKTLQWQKNFRHKCSTHKNLLMVSLGLVALRRGKAEKGVETAMLVWTAEAVKVSVRVKFRVRFTWTSGAVRSSCRCKVITRTTSVCSEPAVKLRRIT